MKYALQQVNEAKDMLENTHRGIKEEIRKILGDKYLVSIHYHYEQPVISVWHDDVKTNRAPAYTLYYDHLEIKDNGDYVTEDVHDALQKIFYIGGPQ